MALEDDFREAARLSHAAALIPQWVQASGGNTSVKDAAADRLVIKASGQRFSEVTPSRGLVAVRLSGVHALLDDASYAALPHTAQQDRAGRELAACVLPGQAEGVRPSLETGFHSLGGRVTLHTHPIALAAGLSMRGGRELLLDALRGVGGGAAWVELRPPGYSLAVLVREALRENPGASLVLLKNHGLVAYGDSVEQVLDLQREAVQRCLALFCPAPAPAVEGDVAVLKRVAELMRGLMPRVQGEGRAHVAEATDPYARAMAHDEAWAWAPVCADDVIFCGLKVPLLSADEALDARRLGALFEGGARRAVAAVRGHGVVMAAPQERSLQYMAEMLHANGLARAMTRSRGETEPLPWQVCLDVAGMEGERYRQKVAS